MLSRSKPKFVNAGKLPIYSNVGCIVDMAYQETIDLAYFVSSEFDSRRVHFSDRDLTTSTASPRVFTYSPTTNELTRLTIEGYDPRKIFVTGLDVFQDPNEKNVTYLFLTTHQENFKAICVFKHKLERKSIKWVKNIVHKELITDPFGIAAINKSAFLVVNCHEEKPRYGFVSLVYLTAAGEVEGNVQIPCLNAPRCIAFNREKHLCYIAGCGFRYRKSIWVYTSIHKGARLNLIYHRNIHVELLANGIHVNQTTDEITVSGAPHSVEWSTFVDNYAFRPDAKCQSRAVTVGRRGFIFPRHRKEVVYSEDGSIISGIGRCVSLPHLNKVIISSPTRRGILVVNTSDQDGSSEESTTLTGYVADEVDTASQT